MKAFPIALGLALTALAMSSAQAAPLDLSPLVSGAISDILVPVALAVVPAIGAILVLPLRRFIDQKVGDVLAGRVDDLLDKAIAFGAKQAESWVTSKNFQANVDGWIANVAAAYAVSHAPTLMKQAGALASAKAGNLVRAQADKLLSEKITARLPAHPAVVAVKALAAPVEPHPALAAAA